MCDDGWDVEAVVLGSMGGDDIFLHTNDGDAKIIFDDTFVDLEELVLGEKLISLNT